MGVPGFIGLSMRSYDTEQNVKIYQAFREMAKVECRNDYTLALEKLLEYYQVDAKTEILWDAMNKLTERIYALEKKSEEPKKDEGETF